MGTFFPFSVDANGAPKNWEGMCAVFVSPHGNNTVAGREPKTELFEFVERLGSTPEKTGLLFPTVCSGGDAMTGPAAEVAFGMTAPAPVLVPAVWRLSNIAIDGRASSTLAASDRFFAGGPSIKTVVAPC